MSASDYGETDGIGVSGFSLFVPRFRVPLEEWCKWTGSAWARVEKNVGRSFRVAGPHESIYTMAANAALSLIRKYEVNPEEIGYLALGTESSTDNSAGAIIVKGMLDQALFGSTTERVVRRAPCPVLTVRLAEHEFVDGD